MTKDEFDRQCAARAAEAAIRQKARRERFQQEATAILVGIASTELTVLPKLQGEAEEILRSLICRANDALNDLTCQ